MNQAFTILLLLSAGIALVVQNLLMVRITASVSTILITLAINALGGLTFLPVMLLWRIGFAPITNESVIGQFDTGLFEKLQELIVRR